MLIYKNLYSYQTLLSTTKLGLYLNYIQYTERGQTCVLREGSEMWNKIEQLMIKQGLNQNTLAKRMSISTSTLTELKMDRIKKPSFELMCKFADALGVSLDELRTNEKKETKS